MVRKNKHIPNVTIADTITSLVKEDTSRPIEIKELPIKNKPKYPENTAFTSIGQILDMEKGYIRVMRSIIVYITKQLTYFAIIMSISLTG
jgi:hypothetical protein